MFLADLITADDVVFGLHAADSALAAAELLRETLTRRRFSTADIKRIAAAVMKREHESATHCGALVIPHARDPRISSFLVAVGINPEGIADDSATQRVMVAFVSPEEKRSEHLLLLSQLARLSRDTRAIDAIIGAHDAATVVDVLRRRMD